MFIDGRASVMLGGEEYKITFKKSQKTKIRVTKNGKVVDSDTAEFIWERFYEDIRKMGF